jgi:xanthine dehydrogenase accessory factor
MLSPNELGQIAHLAERATQSGLDVVIATVVAVAGSSYRRPGARLAVAQDGSVVGAISGGCLEAEVTRRARKVMFDRRPKLLDFDTSEDAEETGASLGCGGRIQILVESPAQSTEHMKMLSRIRHSSVSGMMLTCYQSTFPSVETGALALLQHPTDVAALSMPDALMSQLVNDYRYASNKRRAISRRYVDHGCHLDLLIEPFQPAPKLIIFGAGLDAIPLASCAGLLGYSVTIVDERPIHAGRHGFPPSVRQLRADPESALRSCGVSEQTACVIATHNLHYDLRALEAALKTDAKYIGLLGPKHRARSILDRLPDDAQLDRLYSPIGLDIGADTPEQVALSILSEMQAVFAGRNSGFLRDRSAPIHPRDADSESPSTTYSNMVRYAGSRQPACGLDTDFLAG